ncbi:MAG: hypothetical protein IKD68_08500 [Solobacterium sp.]|nr:hypothetical protein [Solobacterium sp.]
MKTRVHLLKIVSLSAAILFFGCTETSAPLPSPSSAPHSAEELTQQSAAREDEGFYIGNLIGDERDELLIGTIGNGMYQSYITSLFQLGDGNPVLQFSGSETDRLYLLNQGELLEEKSSSEFSSSWNVLGYENGSLVFREGIVYDETLSGDYPWFSAVNTNKAGTSISSEIFMNLMHDYESRIQNPCLISFTRKIGDTFALNNRRVERIVLSAQHFSSDNKEISDPLAIEAILTALKETKIGELSPDGTTDSDDVISCIFDDGSSVSIRFRRGKLAYGQRDECYLLDGSESLFALYEQYSGSSMR